MFKSAGAKKAIDLVDFTQVLRDPNCFQLGHLTDLGLGSEVSAHAFDPVQSLLAVGTNAGGLFVLGGPGVELRWDLGRGALKIKHLAFRCGSGFLAVVDAKDTLSVYDLSRIERGKPVRDSSLSMRSSVTCLEASAAHAFLFLGCQDGTVDVFDLDRGVLAPQARIPNLWLAQDEILRRSGAPDAPSSRHIPVCVDIKAHPLDVNLLLIAYGGGVSLWNISNRQAEMSWEFVVPPGAPGGGNDLEDMLFSERRAGVTCLAWRPDGLMFAAGHVDGCISFACVSDENLIAMRTMERSDVNHATEEDMFGWSAQGEAGHRQPANREPIFRLAWSGFPLETIIDKWTTGSAPTSPVAPSPTSPSPSTPSFHSRAIPTEKTHPNGGTVLTILGGLLPQDPTGVHLFELPPYVSPSGSTVSSTGNIPAALRQALKDSIQPIQHNLYPTPAPPEDFLLFPRQSPHFGLAFDPTAILITTGLDSSLAVLAAAHSARGMEAWTFPPTNSRLPRPLQLPPALSFSGPGTCSSSRLFNISTPGYQRLLHQLFSITDAPLHLPLRGGKANYAPRHNRPTQNPTREGSHQPRILVTLHVDLSVRFWDVSDGVLLGGETGAFDDDFPRPLDHLTINVRDVLRNSAAKELEASRMFKERPWELELNQVDIATETLEVALTISTGEVLVFRHAYGDRGMSGYQAEVGYEHVAEEANDAVADALRDLSMDNIPDAVPAHPSHFYPQIPSPTPSRSPSRSRTGSVSLHHRLTLGRGRRKSVGEKSAMSLEPEPDVQDQHVDLSLVLPLRPYIDGFRPVAAFNMQPARKSLVKLSDVGFLAASSGAALIIVDMRGPEVLFYESGSESGKGKGRARDSSPITSLTWAICAIGEDHDRTPRLIVVQESGYTRVFELSQVAGSWLLTDKVATFHHDSMGGAFSTFVVDKLGAAAVATPGNLSSALSHQTNFSQAEVDAKGALTSVLVSVSPTAVSVYFNVDGPRTAIFEGAGFVSASLTVRLGCPVLVVVGRNKNVTVLSLPDLSQVTRMTSQAEIHSDIGEVSISRDGDFVQVIDPFHIRLHTIFDVGRPAFPPNIVAHRREIPVPPQLTLTTNVTSTFTNLFGGKRVYGPGEIEAALGGPNRPPPKPRTVAIPHAHVRQAPGGPPSPRVYVQSALDSTTGMLARTTEALQERGEYLGSLQQRLGSMADDAAKFAKDSSKMAKQQAAQATLKNSIAGYFAK
ncbi:hypothetical protein P7C70_g320, partial [Phenoliferia sp. Uapishka_3]